MKRTFLIIWSLLACICLFSCNVKNIENEVTTTEGNQFLKREDKVKFWATAEDKTGVHIRSDFFVEEYSLKNRNIETMIRFEPEFEYYATSLGNGKWNIKPKENLSENTLFRVFYRGEQAEYDFAFQTQEALQVEKITPENLDTQVSVEAEISIWFNRPVDEGILSHIKVTPMIPSKPKVIENQVIWENPGLKKDEIYRILVDLKGVKEIEVQFQTEGNHLVKNWNNVFKQELNPQNRKLELPVGIEGSAQYISLLQYDNLSDYEKDIGIFEENEKWVKDYSKVRRENFLGKSYGSYVLEGEGNSLRGSYEISENLPYGNYVGIIGEKDVSHVIFFSYYPFSWKITQVEDRFFLFIQQQGNQEYWLMQGQEEIPMKKQGAFFQSKIQPKIPVIVKDQNRNLYPIREIQVKPNRSFYVDKNIIQSGENIHFFGSWNKEEMWISLYKESLPDKTLKKQKVETKGAYYEGIFSLGNLPTGKYVLELEGETEKQTVPIYVAKESQSEYDIVLHTNKEVYKKGEKIQIEAELFSHGVLDTRGLEFSYDISIGQKNETGKMYFSEEGKANWEISIDTVEQKWRPLDVAIRVSVDEGKLQIQETKYVVVFPNYWIFQEQYFAEQEEIIVSLDSFEVNAKEDTKYYWPFPSELVQGKRAFFETKYTCTAYEDLAMQGKGLFQEVKQLSLEDENQTVSFTRNPKWNYRVELQVYEKGVPVYESSNVIYGDNFTEKNLSNVLSIVKSDEGKGENIVLLKGKKAETVENLTLFLMEGDLISERAIEYASFPSEWILEKSHYWVSGLQDGVILSSDVETKKSNVNEGPMVYIESKTLETGGQIQLKLKNDAEVNGILVFYFVPEEFYQTSSWFDRRKQIFETNLEENWSDGSLAMSPFLKVDTETMEERIHLNLPTFPGKYRLVCGANYQQEEFQFEEWSIEVSADNKLINFLDTYIMGEQPVWQMKKQGQGYVELALYRDGICVYRESKQGNENFSFVPPPFTETGEYILSVSQIAESKKDYREYPIKVIENRFENQQTEIKTLFENLKEEDVKGEETYLLMNKEGAEVMKSLDVLTQVGGSNFSEIYTRQTARALQFRQGLTTEYTIPDLNIFQNEDGGVSEEPKGNSDVRLSAYAYYFGAEGLQKTLLEEYLLGKLNGEETEQALSFWALSKERKPLLNRLREEAKSTVGYEGKIYTILSFLEMGSQEDAEMYYHIWFDGSFKKAGMYQYIETPEEDRGYYNLLAAILHGRMNRSDWKGNVQYAKDHSLKAINLNLEQVLLQHYLIGHYHMEGNFANRKETEWERHSYEGLEREQISGEKLLEMQISGVENMSYVRGGKGKTFLQGITMEMDWEGEESIRLGETFVLNIKVKWDPKAIPGEYILEAKFSPNIQVEENSEYRSYNKDVYFMIQHSGLDRENVFQIPCKANSYGKICVADLKISSSFPEGNLLEKGLLLEIER